jgi:hypothetical protein
MKLSSMFMESHMILSYKIIKGEHNQKMNRGTISLSSNCHQEHGCFPS